MRVRSHTIIVVTLLFASGCASATSPIDLGQPAAPPPPGTMTTDASVRDLEVSVVAPPRRLRRAAGDVLFAEVLINNSGEGPLLLAGAEVLCGTDSLATVAGEALRQNVVLLVEDGDRVSGYQRVPATTGEGDPAEGVRIEAGSLAMLYVAIELDAASEAPESLTFVLSVNDPASRAFGEVRVATDIDGTAPVVIAPPVRGGGWFSANAPSNFSNHRRSVFRIDGDHYLAQRFAIDLVRASPQGETHADEPQSNESYYAWGADVLAVADGVVRAIHDGVPDNTPGGCPNPMDRTAPCDRTAAVPMTSETLAGNTLVLEIAPETFVVYAHLVPGSFQVAEGDRVRTGQVLASLGNSGNSTEAHLHFHLCDRPSVFECQGVAFGLETFVEQRVDPRSGPVGPPEMRRGLMPANHAVLIFPPFPERGGD